MTLTLGLAGAASQACAALCTGEAMLGACPQERVTRVRGSGFNPSGLPDEVVDELLRQSGHERHDITACAVAEPAPPVRLTPAAVQLGHHFAHACAAFLTSPFSDALIVVADDEPPYVSLWHGDAVAVTQVDCPWEGIGLAELYSSAAHALGFESGAKEQRLEALGRLHPGHIDDRVAALIGYEQRRLVLAPQWQASIREWANADHTPTGQTVDARIAAALQTRIGDILVEFLKELRSTPGCPSRLCLGGSLFYNSYLNSRAATSNLFDEVFVPINPGNAGLAVGAALHASGGTRRAVSPFLGPSYSSEEIKSTLDNCKVSYSWMSEGDLIAVAVDALKSGRLVAWFDGAMEWGPRALGHRSILADPAAPFVLENLNRFLKHRPPWRGYALSGLESAVPEFFDGPPSSPFMECDFTPKDPDRWRHFLPAAGAGVRIHTVGSDAPPRFAALLRAFEQAGGVPFLANTSFNGFGEPIVCSPRDAVRVFYSTGLDVLVLGQFLLVK